MKVNANPSPAEQKKQEFFEFLDTLKSSNYDDFYVQSVRSFLDKCTIQKHHNLNSFFKNPGADRNKLATAIKYISDANLLKNKKIIFDSPLTTENFVFLIDFRYSPEKFKK